MQRLLRDQKIITANDYEDMMRGLDQIAKEIEAGQFEFSPTLEDIHMNIENRLSELIGTAAGRLHTARSRNDQVATDTKLWLRDATDNTISLLKDIQSIILERAEEYYDAVMPGFTHLQTAQPVTFGHHLMAYYEMFDRDRTRFIDARKRANYSPLGAAALAGTVYPTNRFQTAEALGFISPTRNSLDSVSDRDFCIGIYGCGIYLCRAFVTFCRRNCYLDDTSVWICDII